MSDIRNQLIKDSYDYVLQSDLGTGVVYRIGGAIPVNPIFQSGLTVTGGFTYSGAGEQFGYALLTDGTGYSYWGPISAATPASGVTSITVGNGLSANSSTGAVTIIFTGATSVSGLTYYVTGSTPTGGSFISGDRWFNTITGDELVYINDGDSQQWIQICCGTGGGGGGGGSSAIQGITGITGTSGVSAITTDYGTTIINTDPDKTVVITGGTGIQIVSDYPNFGINYTGATGITGDYLPLSGGTVSGGTIFQSGLTANTISASTYQNLPITGVTSGTGISITSNGVGGFQITNTSPNQTVTITGGTNIQIAGSYPNFGVNFTGTTGSNFTGGTVNGPTNFTNGLTANTISATTYQNLPSSFQSVRINNNTQFSANTGNFINFSGVNLTITSGANNTLIFSAATGGGGGGVTQITAGNGISISPTGGTGNVRIDATTLIASSSLVIVPDSSIYIGGSTYGWNDRIWDLNDTSFVLSNVNCGIPLPINVGKDNSINICGISYLNGSGDVTKCDFGVYLYTFNCSSFDRGGGGIQMVASGVTENAFDSNGLYCFNLSYNIPKAPGSEFSACTDFLTIGFSSDSAGDSTEARITFTINAT